MVSKNTKTPTKAEKSYFNIHELLVKGKEAVREYNLPEGTVLIRPLSDLEMEACESLLFEYIKDPATRKFAFESPSEDLLAMADEENPTKKALDYNVNYAELMEASTVMMLNIVYLAMRDFTDDFEIEDLRRLNGIKDLAAYIQDISGYSKKSISEVEEFR